MKNSIKKSRLIIITLLIVFLQVSVVRGTNSLTDFITDMKDKAELSVYIKSLQENEVLLTYNENKPLIPASNQKILTTTAAYYLLEHKSHYRTEILWEGEEALQDGIYKGSLVIRGSGDPTLSSVDLMELMKDSRLAELKVMKGDIYVDDTIFEAKPFHPDWSYELAEEVGGLVFDDTALCDFGDPPLSLSKNIGRTLQMILNALGVKHEGEIVPYTQPPAGMELLASHKSMPVKEIIARATKFSDNLITEQLFKTLSAREYGKGSWTMSQKLLYGYYADLLDLDPDSYTIRDGCGLSYENKISAVYLARILEYGYLHPGLKDSLSKDKIHGLARRGEHPYLNIFSIAGVDGTLHARMNDLKVYGKTGTLNGVDALSGFLLTEDGEVIVFSFLVNDFQVSRSEVRNWEDSILRYLSNM